MFRVILPEKRGYKNVFTIVTYKQGGVCVTCNELFVFGQTIISNSNKNTKYYHENCARKVAIIP